jgi:nitroreductase
MDAFDAINQRHGVLHYLGTPVERPKIDAVLQAAITAPSPLNLQPWAFVVITDPKLTRQMAQYLVRVQSELIYGGLMGMGEDYAARMLGMYTQLERVPCFILACLDVKVAVGGPADQPYLRDWYLLSLGAAVENMMVAATALGLGTRWFTGFTLDEEGDTLKRLYGIPKDVEVVAITPLGYHDEAPKERVEQQLADLVQFQPGNGPALAKIFRGKLPLSEVVHENHW